MGILDKKFTQNLDMKKIHSKLLFSKFINYELVIINFISACVMQ